MKAIQTRSPIHLYYDKPNIGKVNLQIWIDKNTNALDVNNSPNYTLTSDAINSEVIFEISELIRSANQYEFEDDFYENRDTAINVLCRADILDINGDRIELQYNLLRVRDGYVQRSEQTQIISNLVNTDFNNWDTSFNLNITEDQSDPFGANEAFSFDDINDSNVFSIEQSPNIKGIHTFSVFIKQQNSSENFRIIFNNTDNFSVLNFDTNGIVNSAVNLIAYDITELNNWYLVSITFNFSENDFVRIVSQDPPIDEKLFVFNPTLIKGNHINQDASDLVLQDNTDIFTTSDISIDVLFDRKRTNGFYGFDSNFKDIFDSSPLISSVSYSINFADIFQDRVIADGGTFESDQCLINYLNEIGSYEEANDDILKFDDLSGERTTQAFVFSELCEPKYTPVKVSFINRFGVIQDLVFFKKRVDSYNTTEEDYKANIITNGQVYPHLGQRRIYNKEAKASLKISSGFYPESFNTVFKQLLYSEMYWIDDEPAILTDSSWTEKTKVNDKLINYDFDFDFGNDDINSIR